MNAVHGSGTDFTARTAVPIIDLQIPARPGTIGKSDLTSEGIADVRGIVVDCGVVLDSTPGTCHYEDE